jgi:hypothetical protein
MARARLDVAAFSDAITFARPALIESLSAIIPSTLTIAILFFDRLKNAIAHPQVRKLRLHLKIKLIEMPERNYKDETPDGKA